MAKKRKNKSQLIRTYRDANPGASSREIADQINKDHPGLKLQATYVSSVLSTEKSKGKSQSNGRKTPAKRRQKAQPAASQNTPPARFELDTLLEAKKLVDRVGSVEKAQAALGALAKLVD